MTMTNTPTMMATVYDKNVYTTNRFGKVVKITPKYIWIDRGWSAYQDIEKYKKVESFKDRSYWRSTQYKRADRMWFEFEQNHLEEFLSNGL
jgi:hypothetical protein